MKEIPLTKGAVAIVDDGDYEALAQHKWHLHSKGYAFRKAADETGKMRSVLMHRVVLGLAHGDRRQGDHRDGNKLNNRRANLRACTHHDNCRNTPISPRNTTGYKGVTFDKKRNRWRARIRFNNQCISLGCHSTAEEAYAAYCEAAKKHFGEFARI